MKHAKYLSMFIFTLFMGFLPVSAAQNACSTAVKKQLATESAYVKVDYEIKDNSEIKTLTIGEDSTTYKIPNYTFEISIYNITDNLYIDVSTTNNSDKKNLTIYKNDTVDGVYTFVDTNMGDIYNYVFTIKSNNSECKGTTIRTLKLTKPRYNAYSEYSYCQSSSNFYCQRFIGTEININSTDEFLAKIKGNNKNNNPKNEEIEEEKEIKDIIKANWKLYLIMFIVVLVLIIGCIFVIRYYRKKKERVL